MKNKFFAFTLDLEPDHGGLLDKEHGNLESPERIEPLLKMLAEEEVKMSVFVVGEVLRKFPRVIELFSRYDAEFHGHSYSHDAHAADSTEEISKCKQVYEEYFKTPPLGYRAPLGKISDQGVASLEKAGFQFDASVFPSFFPNPFKYLFFPRKPHLYKNTSVLEIPNSSLTPLQLTFSISYIKLLGFRFYRTLMEFWKIPDVLVFGCHLHDFLPHPQAIRRLPLFWRMIYSRNKTKGMEYTRRMIRLFRKKGYTFVFMSQINTMFRSAADEAKQHTSR